MLFMKPVNRAGNSIFRLVIEMALVILAISACRATRTDIVGVWVMTDDSRQAIPEMKNISALFAVN